MVSRANAGFSIRNVTVKDIQAVYKLLLANRPYVGLNSRYTYFLLARDFSDTCVVAEKEDRIIGFSSGYISRGKPDTFFNWEIVVQSDYRGYGLQKRMLLHQLSTVPAKFLEATINPSNDVCKKNMADLARLLQTGFTESVLFSEKDFEYDGHEPEILLRIGPFSSSQIKVLIDSSQ